VTAEVIHDNLIMINTDKLVIRDKLSLTVILNVPITPVPEDIL